MDPLPQTQVEAERSAPDAGVAGPKGKATAAGERHHGLKVYDRVLATVTALSLVGGSLWALYTYRAQKEDEAAQRKQEYLLQRHKELKEIYQPLCSAVGKIVSARSLAEAQPAIDKFWELYFGEVHLFEDPNVQKHKTEFGLAVQGWQDRKDETPPTELLPLSQSLVQACQEAIALEKAYGISPDGAVGERSAGGQTSEAGGDLKN